MANKATTRGRQILLLAAIGILCLQGVFAFSFTMNEYLPSPSPLVQFPDAIDRWRAAGEITMEPEVAAMLQPDDYLNRVYRLRPGQAELGLFIAYYKSQHRAAGAHDPKVCLPGSGWNPVSSQLIQIPAAQSPFSANQYVVSKGSLTDVVVYWFQMQHRAMAGTEGLHFRKILEAFTENRTDMALIRIVVPVENNDISGATNRASQFAVAAYPGIMRQFPPRQPSH